MPIAFSIARRVASAFSRSATWLSSASRSRWRASDTSIAGRISLERHGLTRYITTPAAMARSISSSAFIAVSSITGDVQDSHDIARATFLRAWQRFEQVRRYEQPRAWLFRVATMAHISPTHPATLDPAAGVAESAVVRAALLAMPVRQRSALVLRVVYGLSIPEIAEALGASKAAAAMTLSRAREAFRVQYAQEESR